MAHDAGLRLVVSDGDHAGLAGSVTDGVTVIMVDGATAEPPPPPLDPVPVPADALAYTIFTSGSTGRPQGVDIGHRAVANLLAALRRDLGLGAGDRFVAVTAICSDIALLELLLPPVCGADLVIATAEETGEADRLRSLIERSAATAMQATPHTWRLLLSGGGVPASLRLRLCGGETLPRELAAALTAPDAVPWNLYGFTETTVWSAAGPVAAGSGPVELGPAIDHTRVYVLDERLAPVPVGVVGEVHVAGRGVARGYPGRPGRTAAALRPDPWGIEPGARMYATGDLGRWRESGGLELIGRTDHRVSIRGLRAECGEVEAVLRAHRAVQSAAVISAPRAGEPALVAYVVPDPDGPATRPAADLLTLFRPHLRAALPDHMIPTLILALPALPLTPDGMVDRAGLPAPEWADRPAAGRVVPRNPVETTMARIWGDLLRTATPIGVHDNLFDLGGQSLTAIRFAARVVDTYGVTLPMHRIFTTPTIAELAEIVSADPNFGRAKETARDAELAALSDEELDDLLRAAQSARNRRRAAREDVP
jgi:amino acid adenylation domain-containing protein